MNRNNYKYIYKANLANFFMLNGCVCKGTGISKQTGNVYWAFNYYEIQEAYETWNSIRHLD